MHIGAKYFMPLAILCMAPYGSSAQQEIQGFEYPIVVADREIASRTEDRVPLSPDDGLSVIAAALEYSARLSKRDCSHLVHTIYVRAGFPYSYARSSDLYIGTDEFQRVAHPQPGDLVVWRGHVGIVVNPAQHFFYSAMRSGAGTDTYDEPYWKRRGPVRFYRYIKTSRTSSRNRFVTTGEHE